MTLTIREATIADATLIAALTSSCWAGIVAASSAAHRETPAIVAQDLSGGGAFLLFAAQEPVGSVRWAVPDTNPHLWEIHRMGVLPAHRQQALSRLLLEAVIHAAGICSIPNFASLFGMISPVCCSFMRAMGLNWLRGWHMHMPTLRNLRLMLCVAF